MRRRRFLLLLTPLGGVLVLVGCGGSKKALAPIVKTTSRVTTAAGAKTSSAPNAGALQAEARSAATGDIPDNQVFLTFRNRLGGYSMKYPEGWAQSSSGDRVTFRDKNNIVRILVAAGPAPTLAQVRAGMRRLATARVRQPPSSIRVGAAPAVKVVYTTVSAPNAVTGKRVTLLVDRYYLSHLGKQAIVDLGTPQGVDNVDAYRLMIESFRWR